MDGQGKSIEPLENTAPALLIEDSFEHLREFLAQNLYIQSLIKVHVQPDVIRIAARAALNMIMDELEPQWTDNANDLTEI